MRLALVNYVFEPDLTEPEALLERYEALTEWARGVARLGMTVKVVQAFSRSAVLHEAGVTYVFCPADAPRARRVRGMHAEVIAHAPDVVHVNGLDAPVSTWRLRRVLPERAALVVQDHGGTPPAAGVRAAVRRTLMRDVDGYLFTSIDQSALWVQGRFIQADRVYDVPEASTSLCPVDYAEARRTTGMSGRPALLWVGRLQHNKDPLTILEGFARLESRLPEATLTMIFRDADLLSAVRLRMAGSPWLSAHVRLVGEVSHRLMATWYSAADLFVLGSAHEVCGYSVLEACACGTTPVLSDIAPFRMLTANGAIGRLWARGDADGFAAATVAASDARGESRARVRAHFVAHLSWDAVAGRAREIYATVAERRGALGRSV